VPVPSLSTEVRYVITCLIQAQNVKSATNRRSAATFWEPSELWGFLGAVLAVWTQTKHRGLKKSDATVGKTG
jgi:hypothetical protein